MHRRRGALLASTIAVAALTVTAISTASGSVPTAEPAGAESASKVDPAMLEAMQRDLGLTPKQAETRLANEARAAATEAQLEDQLGDAFAGAWTVGKTSQLVIGTTDASTTSTIEAAGATAQVVGESLSELDTIKAQLDVASAEHATTEAPVWYVDVTSNAVILHAKDAAAGEEFVSAAGLDAADVRIVESEESPRPYFDLIGGQAYYMGSGGRCSVGFSVRRGSTPGFATAGHCGRVGTSTRGANQQAQGTFQGSIFPGRDMAWVSVNSNWRVTPRVQGSAQQVAGSTQQPVGATICRSGSTTGWHCGRISQHNTSVRYPEGTITGVTRTTVCAEPGDSGGAYISGSQAQGVTSGGSGNCRTGGTTYHQPINPLLSQWGLTLVTTGGGDPTNPDPTNPDPTNPDPTNPDPTDPGGTWAPGVHYTAGQTVTYGGATYRCLQSHTSQSDWTPPATPALWQRL